MPAPGYDSVDLTWSVPATYRTTCRIGATGGGAECVAAETPLTGFTVYYSIQAFGTRTALGVMSKDTSGGALTDGTGVYELTGLDPETTYFATIVARNAFGPANIVAASVANTTTTAAPVPEQVARVEVTSGEDMKVTASWDAPRPDKDANRTNHTIAMYNVQYRTSQTVTNSPGDWMPTKPMEVSGSMTTTEITGLTNGTEYDVQVRAVNDATGVGAWSAQSSTTTGTPGGDGTTTPPPTTPPPTTPPPTTPPPTTPPPGDGTVAAGAPEKVVIQTSETKATTNSITFSWITPGSGMSALVDYQLEYMAAGQAVAFSNNIDVKAGTTQSQVVPPVGKPALEPGTVYMIRLRAQNREQGYGPWSDYLTQATKAVPVAPDPEPSPAVSKVADPMVEAGDKMLMVSWTEPASEKSITHYLLDYRTASAKKWMDKPMTVTAMNYTIKGLINGTVYLVRVRAVDSAGNMGEWSDNGSGTPMADGDTDPGPDPVPALPIFGAVALGAGLLAAGRARLRRRELRAGRVQRQINR